MRQLSARVRRVAVTALTIAASTACMSVGEDSAEPAPAQPSGRKEQSAHQPDGETVSGTGQSGHAGGRAHAQNEPAGSSRAPEPGASVATPSPTPDRAARPAPRPGTPEPGPGGALPTLEPSTPAPEEPSPPEATPEPTPPAPEPEPSQPPDEPSASPAAQFRSRAAQAPGWAEAMGTPMASPQVAPV
ncbi:hypothetical protein STHAL_10995 [Streptomyces halstedii]|uniref:Lipoprotein n=1 Tax=Streptomyces halstedii TaxID=1944 RepID=A0ABS6TPM7_STRHA|nr:hypothetical protein [Streptomyces halstedii]MBV7669998.1 hypothetical protein [Streptomyces halstedii]